MAQKVKEKILIEKAMDNLAAIASIDMNDPPPLGIVKRVQLVTSQEEFGPETAEWLSSEGVEPIFHILSLTYKAIYEHLLRLYEDPEMDWENEKTKRGVAAMMDLVGESAEKMEKFLSFRLGKKLEEAVRDLEEFQILQKFYSNKFSSRFEGEKAWGEQWEENEFSEAFDISKTGLKDFETVKRDLEYELFYIRTEDGKPYFNAQLLRNIRLCCDFDLKSESFEEDPLLKVRAVQDRDLNASAGQILKECDSVISDFCKIAHTLEGNEFAANLGMGIIALFLANNPRYLIQNTMGKSCFQYFEDFQLFLRRAMKTAEYQKLIAYPPDPTDKTSHILLMLTHLLARSLFERAGGVKLETIGLIHRVMRKGEESVKKEKGGRLLKGESLWNQFLLDDEKFRTFLAKFPNGPIFKILDLVREESEEDASIPFDPIGAQNFPSQLFHLEKKGKKIGVFRIPSPTRQWVINKAEIVDEFRGFLRSLAQERRAKKKHLLINLQDRTSWKEYARSRTLETLQMNAEFNQHLVVITLPKESDFYHQNNEYLNLNKAEEFLKTFSNILESEGDFGYFLPAQLKKTELSRFNEMVLPLIHECFFHGKNALMRKNREDFIEIFNQFFILKCIEILDPSSISFTCKDAIDTGSAAVGCFYGFVQLLSSDFSKKERWDFLRYLLYAPALFIRERALDPGRFNRCISALERIDSELFEKGNQILKKFSELYDPQFLKTLRIGD